MSRYYLGLWGLGCALGFMAGLIVLQAQRALNPRTVVALVIAWIGLLVGAKVQYRLEYLSTAQAFSMSLEEFRAAGMRLPLGLASGALLALTWCIIVREPWRIVGDALAVAASVTIAIGRIGCFLNGCCTGAVCGTWRLPWCLQYPPGTEAYALQQASSLIRPGAMLSLPVHPLPVYFGFASVLTLCLLVLLLRANFPTGTALAAFCILRPLTKLGLEPLRAASPGGPQGLMLLIPLGTLMLTVGWLGVTYLRSQPHKEDPARRT